MRVARRCGGRGRDVSPRNARSHFMSRVCLGADDDRSNRSAEELSAALAAAIQYVRGSAEVASVVNCSKGHRFVLLVQDLGYALLFERALFHLVDGSAGRVARRLPRLRCSLPLFPFALATTERKARKSTSSGPNWLLHSRLRTAPWARRW